MAVREIPPGSGINGRPVLRGESGWVRHTAYYRAGKWRLFCDGSPVPCDHMCPSRDEADPNRWGPITNCWGCHERWEASRRNV